MPEPRPDPNLPELKRVAMHSIIAAVAIMLLKLGVFALTNSAAVLSDALESIINVASAGFLLYTIWLANRPADRTHPYGHGKIEFMAIGLEAWFILIAGIVIAVEAVRRFISPVEVQRPTLGVCLLAGIGVLCAAIAAYVWHMGRKYDHHALRAHGKHLMTDLASTVGVLIGLLLVRYTEKVWLDPLFAIVMAALILFASWKLMWQSIHGLMDRIDEKDDSQIRAILDDEVASGQILSYHKVRHRHSGSFHWVDMHLQFPQQMTVHDAHAIASRIEGRIEQELGQANATAHLEPASPASPAEEA
jgi:cation diffusion facilitator family transporter